MICPLTGQECNKPRTCHVTENINGVQQTLDLCEECSTAYMGQPEIEEIEKIEEIESKKHPNVLEGVFSLLFNMMKQAQPGVLGVTDKECENCGTMLSDVQTSGKLGCPECYNVFGQELAYFFTQSQQSNEHVGKVPAKDIPEPAPLLLVHEKSQIEKELQEAIEQEDYEKAAALRDRLKSIK